jgi:hypothetical protein
MLNQPETNRDNFLMLENLELKLSESYLDKDTPSNDLIKDFIKTALDQSRHVTCIEDRHILRSRLRFWASITKLR